MTEEQEILNPFPIKAIEDRIKEIERPIVEKLVAFANGELKNGKLGVSKIEDKQVLKELLFFPQFGLTNNLLKFAETI